MSRTLASWGWSPILITVLAAILDGPLDEETVEMIAYSVEVA